MPAEGLGLAHGRARLKRILTYGLVDQDDENMDRLLGDGNGENIEDPELEGVSGQQVFPQTAY